MIVKYRISLFGKNLNNQDESLLNISVLKDPRTNCNVAHKFNDIVTITVCAVICGAEDWTAIEAYGNSKKEWLSSFLELPNGIPSMDTFRRVFLMLDMNIFEAFFKDWVKKSFAKKEGDIISLDGKTVRSSHDQKNNKSAIHIISAWSSTYGISIGQFKTNEKSNEITAIPEFLKLLNIKGCIITIDAIGTQRKIVKEISQKGADYVLCLKKNHPDFYKNTKKVFETIAPEKLSSYIEDEKRQHGRSEKREYYLAEIPNQFSEKYVWCNIKCLGMVKRERFINNVLSTEIAYYITSLSQKDIEKFSRSVRSHWGIENNLHWQLDISFNEDRCRKRMGNSAANFAILRRFVLNLLRSEKTNKGSINIKRKTAGWDDNYLLKVLGIHT